MSNVSASSRYTFSALYARSVTSDIWLMLDILRSHAVSLGLPIRDVELTLCMNPSSPGSISATTKFKQTRFEIVRTDCGDNIVFTTIVYTPSDTACRSHDDLRYDIFSNR